MREKMYYVYIQALIDRVLHCCLLNKQIEVLYANVKKYGNTIKRFK